MPQAVNVSEFALAGENFLRPLASHVKRPWECAQELNDLSDVVVIFAVLGARLGVEEIIASDQFENL